MNGVGEPVEFVHCSIAAFPRVLWPAGLAQRKSIRALLGKLFEGCRSEPVLLFCGDGEFGVARILSEDFELGLSAASVRVETSTAHDGSRSPRGPTLHLSWIADLRSDLPAARRLLEELEARNLLAEPFERAEAALRELEVAA
jgi:hypothetical protein